MVNYKSKYLAMKLKYINAKQKAGSYIVNRDKYFLRYTKQELKDFLINDIHRKNPNRNQKIVEINSLTLSQLRINFMKMLERTGVPGALSVNDAINRTLYLPDPHYVPEHVPAPAPAPPDSDDFGPPDQTSAYTESQLQNIYNKREEFKQMTTQQLKQHLKRVGADPNTDSRTILIGRSIVHYRKMNFGSDY